jgi:cell wall-associated NlpC family hydrolase
LKRAYTEWRGTPYQLGGTTLKGVDCSAFMQVIFDDYLGEKLPRTTLEQMKVGKKIRRKRVDLGDLVFFKTGPTTYHVGVMVDRRHFLHAGTTGGVMISDLNARYWTVRYLTARRVL